MVHILSNMSQIEYFAPPNILYCLHLPPYCICVYFTQMKQSADVLARIARAVYLSIETTQKVLLRMWLKNGEKKLLIWIKKCVALGMVSTENKKRININTFLFITFDILY